jgi:phage shock protein E
MKMDEVLKNLINEGAFLVDVRSPEEFAEGHVANSINIPVGDVMQNLDQFADKTSVLVFCRSGNRSEMAKALLQANGVQNVFNAGTWQYVDSLISK